MADSDPLMFNGHGLLPEGVHPCDDPTFHARFVHVFSTSTTRTGHCDGFMRLRQMVLGFGLGALQWVDGSFVTNKVDPGDIDAVTFIDYDLLVNLDPNGRQFLLELVNNGEETKATFHTHTFVAATCNAGHRYHPIAEKARRYWRTWFGKTRDVLRPDGTTDLGQPKGFVQMPLGDPARVPAVSTSRSAA
jgi:hypothetical protein